MIQPSASFKDNLQQLPKIDGITRVNLLDANGAVMATIENQPGKQGSLAVYHYLQKTFASLNKEAATHGLAIFAEHTADAQQRPGAHPNIDRLLDIVEGGGPLTIQTLFD